MVKPNAIKTCEGLGMPFHKTPYKHGNLFISFKVVFPNEVGEGQISQIKTLLKDMEKSKKEQAELAAIEEIYNLQMFDESQKNTHAQGGTRGGDSEEEEDDGEGH